VPYSLDSGLGVESLGFSLLGGDAPGLPTYFVSLNLRLKDLLGPVTRVKKKKKKSLPNLVEQNHTERSCSLSLSLSLSLSWTSQHSRREGVDRLHNFASWSLWYKSVNFWGEKKLSGTLKGGQTSGEC